MSGFDWDKSDPDEEPAVGYGRPPKHTRFKKGQSGNPSGRPKKSEQGPQTTANVEDSIRALVGQVVTFKRNGEEVEGTIFDVMANKLVALAMQGDLRAMKFVMDYAEKFKLEASPEDPEKQRLLKQFFDDQMAMIKDVGNYRRTIGIYEELVGKLPKHVRMGFSWIPEGSPDLARIRTMLKEGAKQQIELLSQTRSDLVEEDEEEDF